VKSVLRKSKAWGRSSVIVDAMGDEEYSAQYSSLSALNNLVSLCIVEDVDRLNHGVFGFCGKLVH